MRGFLRDLWWLVSGRYARIEIAMALGNWDQALDLMGAADPTATGCGNPHCHEGQYHRGDAGNTHYAGDGCPPCDECVPPTPEAPRAR